MCSCSDPLPALRQTQAGSLPQLQRLYPDRARAYKRRMALSFVIIARITHPAL